jgi:hypothetical protein
LDLAVKTTGVCRQIILKERGVIYMYNHKKFIRKEVVNYAGYFKEST